eukprot:8448103-Alexandrium_andersonii.AAC.1
MHQPSPTHPNCPHPKWTIRPHCIIGLWPPTQALARKDLPQRRRPLAPKADPASSIIHLHLVLLLQLGHGALENLQVLADTLVELLEVAEQVLLGVLVLQVSVLLACQVELGEWCEARLDLILRGAHGVQAGLVVAPSVLCLRADAIQECAAAAQHHMVGLADLLRLCQRVLEG